MKMRKVKKEILFRGKDGTGIMNYGWFYGSLDTSFNQDFPRIICKDKWGNTMLVTVDGDTVGQFTGLCDKNGEKIFEGDVVKILYTDWASKSENDTRTLEEYLDSLTRVGVVWWDDISLCYSLEFNKDVYGSIHCGKYGYIEVIGNKFDNPEILEGV